jgi:chlorosome envelope protein B
MANESANTGVFSDLFNAVGILLQGVADTVSNGICSAAQLVETLGKTSVSIVEGVVNAATQVLEGLSSAIAPKK